MSNSLDLFSGRSRGWLEGGDPDPYAAQTRDHFLALIGGEFDYYGADGAEHEFKIDGIVFRVLEDPQDGYRSCLGVIEYSPDQSRGIFFTQALARVRLEQYDRDGVWGDSDRGYALVDVDDGHVWLEFGTDNYSDYYPIFVFRHWAKPPA